MRNRVSRGVIALTTALAVLAAPAPLASASTGQTIHDGSRVCSMFVNSSGFGAYCSSGKDLAGFGGTPPTWRERLRGRIFIPCRDFPVPEGINVPPAPEGKDWVWRLTIVDYDLDQNDGGDNVHVERMMVAVDAEEREQCSDPGYMEQFWDTFQTQYPAPVMTVKPTFVPRVNVPAYFALTRDSSYIYRVDENDPAGNPDSAYWNGNRNLTMRAIVRHLKVDPGDGSKPIDCLMGVGRADEDYDGYDDTKDPFHQLSTCFHVYKRSSAKQPDGMYTVKLTITWEVSYWAGGPEWQVLGSADVRAVQRLPVQEVQAIGG